MPYLVKKSQPLLHANKLPKWYQIKVLMAKEKIWMGLLKHKIRLLIISCFGEVFLAKNEDMINSFF